MNKAHLYERFILKAFQCKPYDYIGADYKIYLNLMESESHYFEEKNKTTPKTEIIIEFALKYGIQLGIVTSNIKEAIAHVLHEYSEKLTPIQVELFEVYIDELNDPTRKKIDEIIELSTLIFEDIGLEENPTELNTKLSASQG